MYKRQLLHSVRFSSDGELLWALSGEGVLGTAQQTTQLVAVTVSDKEPGGIKRSLQLGKPIEVKDAGLSLIHI